MAGQNDEIQKMLDDERAALAPEKVATLEATEAMKAMLAVPEKTDDAVYEFRGVKIRHHRFLTKRLRLVMGQVKSNIKKAENQIAEQDTLVYQMLSEMCTEAPWNDPDAWRMADLRSNDGRVYQIFCELLLTMGGDETILKDFRRKSGRPVSA
jgi:hypothetical protein